MWVFLLRLNWTIIIASRLDSSFNVYPHSLLFLHWVILSVQFYAKHIQNNYSSWGNLSNFFAKKEKTYRRRVCKISSNTTTQNLELEILSVFPDVYSRWILTQLLVLRITRWHGFLYLYKKRGYEGGKKKMKTSRCI